jgi:hypothetical protein
MAFLRELRKILSDAASVSRISVESMATRQRGGQDLSRALQ